MKQDSLALSPVLKKGIQVVPEKRGDPRVAVKPRDLDPGISTIPDVEPPAHKGINPPGRGTQHEYVVYSCGRGR